MVWKKKSNQKDLYFALPVRLQQGIFYDFIDNFSLTDKLVFKASYRII